MNDAEAEYLDVERWRGIENHTGYFISSHGRVLGRSGRILRSYQNYAGYLRVQLVTDGGEKINYRVHRLVALAFVENPDELPEVHHKDNDPSNSHFLNLEWCSREYNEQAKYTRWNY